MPATIIDSIYFGNGWSTPELRAIFDDEKKLQTWLDIESVLARVQGELGIIPLEAAKEISLRARLDQIDIGFFKNQLAATGHALIPLIRALEKACKNGHGEYVHFGATTQDVIDTGAVLLLREATNIFLRDALLLEKEILALAEQYIDLPMVGRTHGQHAMPITLGFKFAGWGAELRRSIERLKEIPKRSFYLMMHGAVGTMAGFGPRAQEVVSGVAEKLGLNVPPICWNNARDGFAEYLNTLGILAGTLGRVANEIISLSLTELGEVSEPATKHTVGSSTMPHKRNPALCELTVAQSRIVHSLAQLGLAAMINSHERDPRSWRLDLYALPHASLLVGKMLSAMLGVVRGLVVHEEAIARNLELSGGAIFSEAVMLRLAEKLGKQTAHQVLHELTEPGITDSRTFKQRVVEAPALEQALGLETVESLFSCSSYLGEAREEVRKVIHYCNGLASTDPVFA